MKKRKRFIKRVFTDKHNDLGTEVILEVILKVPAGLKWTILSIFNKNYHPIGVFINDFPLWFPDEGTGAEAGASVFPIQTNRSGYVSQWTLTGAINDQTAVAITYGGVWLPIPFTMYGGEILRIHAPLGIDASEQLMIRYIEEDWIEA